MKNIFETSKEVLQEQDSKKLEERAFNLLALDKLIAEAAVKGDKKGDVFSELENFYNAQPEKYNKRLNKNELFAAIVKAFH